MEQEKLVITKENYKGYVELYKTINTNFENREELIIKTLINFGVILLSLLITIPLDIQGLLPNVVKHIQCTTLIVVEAFIYIKHLKKTSDYTKKQLQNVKEKYPYVDMEIKKEELERSLVEAKVVTRDKYEYVFKSEKSCEDYWKAEEIKEKYFEETKYDKYIVNPEITQEELEKPKVKKLVR